MEHAARHLDYSHLIRLTDSVGVFEHAEGAIVRREHGYCTDDNARALIAATRAGSPLGSLVDTYLGFLRHAQQPDGRFTSRMGFDRRWMHEDRHAGGDDACGRALWSLGVAARAAPSHHQRQAARLLFERGAGLRSRYRRATSFAVLGACELLAFVPDHDQARRLLDASLPVVCSGSSHSGWLWPEERLTYANAVVPHAMLTAGAALGDRSLMGHGFELLEWLVSMSTHPAGHLSVTAAVGWSPDDRPAFDQQPIEVASLAEAAACAYELSDADHWLAVVERAVEWFHGRNDGNVVMFDPLSGGGYDGLTAHGPNINQGAESTLAWLSTMQIAHTLTSRLFTSATSSTMAAAT